MSLGVIMDCGEGPSNLSFMVGWRCNSRCVMCIRWRPGAVFKPAQVELAPAQVDAILRAYTATCRNVTLISFGEPFLSPGFPEIVRLTGARVGRLGGALSCITNGSLLHEHPEVLDYPGWLTVSADAPDAAGYERIRQGLSYDRLLANLQLARRRAGPGRVLNVNMVVFRWNASQVHEMARFLSGLGWDALSVLWGGCPPESMVAGEELLRSDPGVIEQIQRARVDFPGLTVLDYFQDARGQTGRCRRPWTDAVVFNDGTVHPCCVAKKVWFGTCEQPEPWRGGRWDRLRLELAAGGPFSPEFEICSGCVWR